MQSAYVLIQINDMKPLQIKISKGDAEVNFKLNEQNIIPIL
jgi:hypothetical protein